MAAKKIKITNRLRASGRAMDATARRATRKAVEAAFKKRKTIMVERDGWLVMVNKTGRVVKKVKRLPKLVIPAA